MLNNNISLAFCQHTKWMYVNKYMRVYFGEGQNLKNSVMSHERDTSKATEVRSAHKKTSTGALLSER